MELKQVNILGTQYTIYESNQIENPALNECDGYCDETTKECIIDSTRYDSDPMAKRDIQAYKDKVLRHEVIHAFLFESGLAENSWAANEEIVDWIASMFPKIKTVFEQLGVS